jgi:hypothetical protein
VKLQTLSDFGGGASKPAASDVFPPFSDTPSTYSDHFVEVMQFVFNHTTFDSSNDMDQAALAALKQVGVEPGKKYDPGQTAGIDGKQLKKIEAEVTKKQVATWSDPKKAGPYLTKLFQPKGHMDIDSMVLQSAVGPLGQPADQAMYPGVGTSDGKQMNAQHDYVIRMTRCPPTPRSGLQRSTTRRTASSSRTRRRNTASVKTAG